MPSRRRVTFSLDDAEYQKLCQVAKLNRVAVSYEVAQAVSMHLANISLDGVDDAREAAEAYISGSLTPDKLPEVGE